MLFNSSEYYVFLIGIVFLYYVIPHRHRYLLLLAGSYFFYLSWKIEYGLLLLLSTVIDYYAGYQMGKKDTRKARKPYLIISLLANLGMLVVFKYLNFFSDIFQELLGVFDTQMATPAFSILLPIGISFYTFQSLSYSIEIYRGNQQPEKNFGIFALYVSFFPQLVSGPIERPGDLLPQFRHKVKLNFQQITDGLKLIVWGLFLKMVLADHLAVYVNQVFQSPESYKGLSSLTAIYFFAAQVYGDFAGYTNIAIGSAMLLGFRLSDNFRLPYLATSIRDFWSRWHITLTNWMRDYLYFSLGGNRKRKWRSFFNLYIVFIAVAVWHGTDTKLLLFGTLHFLFYLIQKWFKPIWGKGLEKVGLAQSKIFNKALPIIVTFHLVAFTWVVWWADSWEKCVLIISNVFSWQNYHVVEFVQMDFLFHLVMGVVILLFTVLVYSIQGRNPERQLLNHCPIWARYSILYILLFALMFLSDSSNSNAFIYFQF